MVDGGQLRRKMFHFVNITEGSNGSCGYLSGKNKARFVRSPSEFNMPCTYRTQYLTLHRSRSAQTMVGIISLLGAPVERMCAAL